MQFEAGKFYRTRCGCKAEVFAERDGRLYGRMDITARWWWSDGRVTMDRTALGNHTEDLIAPWEDADIAKRQNDLIQEKRVKLLNDLIIERDRLNQSIASLEAKTCDPPETIEGFINVYRPMTSGRAVCIYASRPQADRNAGGSRVRVAYVRECEPPTKWAGFES